MALFGFAPVSNIGSLQNFVHDRPQASATVLQDVTPIQFTVLQWFNSENYKKSEAFSRWKLCKEFVKYNTPV